MCIVCHGPVPLRQNRTGTTCNQNCRSALRDMRMFGWPLADKYEFIRWTHAYRRRMLNVQRLIGEMVGVQRAIFVENRLAELEVQRERKRAREGMRKLYERRAAQGLTSRGEPLKKGKV